MHRPHSTRALAFAAFAACALLPALALALPPVFLPGPSESGLLKPGGLSLNARATLGAAGSYDPGLSPRAPFAGGGGGEIGLSKAVRTTLDGRGGLIMGAEVPGAPETSVYFAGGRWGLRIVTPTGAPEFGFGVGGGAVGAARRIQGQADACPNPAPTTSANPVDCPDSFEPDEFAGLPSGYVSTDFELMNSQDVGGGYVSAVARVGPSFEIRAPEAEGLAPTFIPSFGGLAELTLAVELAKTFHLTFAGTVMVGHDGAAVTKDSPLGSAYGGILGSIGFITRPPGPK